MMTVGHSIARRKGTPGLQDSLVAEFGCFDLRFGAQGSGSTSFASVFDLSYVGHLGHW